MKLTKSFYQIQRRSTISLLFLAAVFVLSVKSASAEEMFPNLRWTHFTSQNHLEGKANADLLAQPYLGRFSYAITGWQVSATPTVWTSVDFSSSKVDLVTPSTSWWSSHGISSSTAAITIVMDTSGKEIWNAADASASNKNISYANIYFNPSDAPSDNTWRTKIITHEMGHVFDLGHPYTSSIPTIMLQGQLSYYSPTSKDKTDLESMYNL